MESETTVNRIINLTGQRVCMYDKSNTLLEAQIPTPDKDKIDYKLISVKCNSIDGAPITSIHCEMSNLPDPKLNTYYIVNRVIATHTDRNDFLVPIRIHDNDDSDEFIACGGFFINFR